MMANRRIPEAILLVVAIFSSAHSLPLVNNVPLVGSLLQSLPLVGDQASSPLGGNLVPSVSSLPVVGPVVGNLLGNLVPSVSSLPVVGPVVGNLLGGSSLPNLPVGSCPLANEVKVNCDAVDVSLACEKSCNSTQVCINLCTGLVYQVSQVVNPVTGGLLYQVGQLLGQVVNGLVSGLTGSLPLPLPIDPVTGLVSGLTGSLAQPLPIACACDNGSFRNENGLCVALNLCVPLNAAVAAVAAGPAVPAVPAL